ncbi:MAG TPA: DtxR family transcriptional regulator [Lachnospiraceae bacterium]|nr:DtxR family transcriptional regulator [Lachnospiraceae bacterium]
MPIQESGEDYLETILILHLRNGAVRAIDIARELGYSKPSVSRAMGILKRDGHIDIDDNNHISLTESGKQIAEEIYDRHVTLTSFFEKIGVDSKTAEKDACRIEHVISPITFEKIRENFMDYD